MGLGGKLLTFSFFAAIIAAAVQLILHNDLLKHTYSHQPGQCRLVKPIVDGSEDLELLPNGYVALTSGLVYIKCPENAKTIGKLFLFNFNENHSANEPKAVETKLIWDAKEIKQFNPHGLKSFIGPKGEITLYVINHAPDGERIELFNLDVSTNTAKHVKSIKHELIKTPNNLAIVSSEEFYISNDHYFQNHIGVKLEYHTPYIRLGNIVHYNKGSAKVVDHFLHTPNGLTIDKKKKFLFVASPMDRSLSVYNINQDKTITKSQKFKVDTAIDNLFLDEETFSVWTGAHPNNYQLMQHITAPKSVKAPSQVIKFQFKDATYSDLTGIFDPYSDDGSKLCASSAVVKYKNQILIGTVDHKMMLCEI